MPNAMTASALALVSAVGTILGVSLGRSTIAQINPAYYSSPPPGHLYADLTPAGYRPGSSQEPSADLWAAAETPPVCTDCAIAAPVERYIDPRVTSEQVWQPSEPVPQVIRGIPQGQLDEYSHFPVTREEARQQAAEEPARYAEREPAAANAVEAEPEPDGL